MSFSGQHCEFLSEKSLCDLYRKTDLQDPPYKHMDMLPQDIPILNSGISMTALFLHQQQKKPPGQHMKQAMVLQQASHISPPAVGIPPKGSCRC